MSLRPAIAERARVLLLVMLILGQLLLPAVAAACAVADAVPGIDAVSAAAGDTGDDTGADCCGNAACSDCCLHAGSAPVTATRAAPVGTVDVEPVPPPTARAVGEYAVDIRPPIAM